VSKKQSPFLGSQRQVRGAVLRALADGPKSEQALLREVTSDLHDVMVVIAMLETEGFVECHGTTWSLAGDHDN
jgi:predicted Rossmann fold nucleotide-binding protein DprA/Smf involved in DNA uptake